MNSVTVTACQYPVTVYESEMDVCRGDGTQFTEVFIPEYRAGFSSRGYVFKSEKPRNVKQFHSIEANPMKEITIPRELAEKIDRVATAQLKLEQDKKQIHREIDTFFQDLAKPGS